MAHVVFLRGVNVGGHKTFRPSQLVTELADYDVVNIGAAGTFVVRGKVAAKTLERRLREKLPFVTAIFICPAEEIAALAGVKAFARAPAAGVKRYVTVLEAAPARLPALPLAKPTAAAWEVKLLDVAGRYAFSEWRPRGERRAFYPNEVVEKELGVSATTRGWETIAQVSATSCVNGLPRPAAAARASRARWRR